MNNENNTNKPQPLTPDQQKARDTALAASKGVVTPQVPALPGAPTNTGAAQKPISELVTAATTALANTDNKAAADVAVAALATAAANPINPDKVASTNGKPATDKGHAAAIAKANANVGKPQGSKPATAKGGKSTPATATPAVTAAKPVKLNKGEQAFANPNYVEGFNISKWRVVISPVDGKPVPAPSRAAIIAAYVCGRYKTPSANCLALAFYLDTSAQRLNVAEVGELVGTVMGLSGDNKQNTALKAEAAGLVTLDRSGRVPWSNGANGGRVKVAYKCIPSGGLKATIAALEAKKVAPLKHWLPVQKPVTDKGKGAPATLPAGK